MGWFLFFTAVSVLDYYWWIAGKGDLYLFACGFFFCAAIDKLLPLVIRRGG